MKKADLAAGSSVIIVAGDKEIAVFNYKDKFYALANTCPHKGSPLGEGRIEEGVVICPGHEWRFNLDTGNCMQNPYMKIMAYPVRLKDDYVYVGLEPKSGVPDEILGKKAASLPSDLKFKVPTILKPRNLDEEL